MLSCMSACSYMFSLYPIPMSNEFNTTLNHMHNPLNSLEALLSVSLSLNEIT